MGATDRFMTLKGDMTKEQVKEAFYKRQEEDRWEYGNDPYNGSFTTFSGIEFKWQKYDNENDARSFVLDKQEKWGPAFAVKVENDTQNIWVVGGWAAE